jgi:hypothetical protein
LSRKAGRRKPLAACCLLSSFNLRLIRRGTRSYMMRTIRTSVEEPHPSSLCSHTLRACSQSLVM